MVLYVKGKGNDFWHWCKNCSKYPEKEDIIKTIIQEPVEDLCPECHEKRQNNYCEDRTEKDELPPVGATNGEVF